MINQILTASLIKAYDFWNGGEISRTIRQLEQSAQKTSAEHNAQLKEYLNSWGIDKEISEISPIGKKEVRELTKGLDPKAVEKFYYTGGSTGEPLKLPYSKKRSLVRTASGLYFNTLGGYNIGDPYLFIRSKKASKISQIIKNELLFVPNDLSEENMVRLIGEVYGKRVKVMIGYPSVIYDLALAVKKNGLEKKVNCIKSFVSTSEPLDPGQAVFIRDVLSCSVIDRYSNEENGIIAQQDTFGGEYSVNRFNLFVEIVDSETFKPVNEGETGKVLVTDMLSDLIPIVRYDTGDYAKAGNYDNDQLITISEIKGRITDRFITVSGKPISPLILLPYIRIPLSDIGVQVQFQMVQIDEGNFKVLLKADSDEVPKKNIQKIENGLTKVLGDGSVINFEFVESIEALPSGKRPLYRNLMKE